MGVNKELKRMKEETLKAIEQMQKPELTEEQKKRQEIMVKRQDYLQIKNLLHAIKVSDHAIFELEKEIFQYNVWLKGVLPEGKDKQSIELAKMRCEGIISQREHEKKRNMEELFYMIDISKGDKTVKELMADIFGREAQYQQWYEENFSSK